MERLPGLAVAVLSYVVGAIPFSGILARLLRGIDLRTSGSGTVSGTGLYRIAGWRPLFVGGVLDLAKGSVGPLLAGRRRPVLQAAAGGAAVAGHNWSPYLGGAGGRGLSPALGALLPTAPEGSALLLAGLAAGKLAGATSVGALVADLALVPVLARRRGRCGALAGAAVVIPMLAKRIAGNEPPSAPRRLPVYAVRLVFDQDYPPWRSGGRS
jgi:glycerol-3-phosphate acyltransferase PlsY